MWNQVKLPQGIWEYDESIRLGPPGGFGEVFEGRDLDGQARAVKRLFDFPIGPIPREVENAEHLLGHKYPHVIGVYAVGVDEGTDKVFIVMDKAQMSLQDMIEKNEGLEQAAAVEILQAIAMGLDEIGEWVHRDLKPGNILLHQGIWKLADWGLARIIETTTATNTMRLALSPDYAAPEQWRGERPAKATDVYAFGGIIYALLTGTPPFIGPEMADFQKQHLYETPAPVANPSALSHLAIDCLAKSPLVRPTIEVIRRRLVKINQRLSTVSVSPLMQAALLVATEKAQAEAEDMRQKKQLADREEAATGAMERLNRIMARLIQEAFEEADGSRILTEPPGVALGKAALYWRLDVECYRKRPELPGLDWDIIASALVHVDLGYHKTRVQGCESSLWFGRLSRTDGYRWWEVMFVPGPAMIASSVHPPGVTVSYGHIPAGKGYRDGHPLHDMTDPWLVIAGNPVPIDLDAEEDFISRWKANFAQAALYRPGVANPFDRFPEPISLSSEFLLAEPSVAS